MRTKTILNLDPVIHMPVRLAIMSVLIAVEHADFGYLKEVTDTTAGNLSSHLSKLESSGFITIRKSFRGKRPHTTCSLTAAGSKAFITYIDQLGQIVAGEKTTGA
jgi:DNA-binding HxlR family transcriptional regulator